MINLPQLTKYNSMNVDPGTRLVENSNYYSFASGIIVPSQGCDRVGGEPF